MKNILLMISFMLVMVAILMNLAPARALGAEAELMVAPHLRLAETQLNYVEEASNFFGTQLHLLKSPELARRVMEKTHGKKALQTDVEVIPKTSIFKIKVSGGSEEENRVYLDALIQEFFDDRVRLREEVFQTKIRKIEKALAEEKDAAIRQKLEESLRSVKLSFILGDSNVLRRIK